MMTWLALLAWTPFVNPIPLPAGWRLWFFLPLAACVALVYRGTRARSARELPRGATIAFMNIVVGMVVIAIVAYVIHLAALQMSRA